MDEFEVIQMDCLTEKDTVHSFELGRVKKIARKFFEKGKK